MKLFDKTDSETSEPTTAVWIRARVLEHPITEKTE
jgi:hypothetical protein